jgi:hypothetical protein
MAGAGQPRRADGKRVDAVVLEAIAAGIVESCQNLRLSQLGKDILQPVLGALSEFPMGGACEEIFQWCGHPSLGQDCFVLGFTQLLQCGKGAFEELARRIDQADWTASTKEVLRYTGIRPRTVLCLLAIDFKERARYEGIVLQEGQEVRMRKSGEPL